MIHPDFQADDLFVRIANAAVNRLERRGSSTMNTRAGWDRSSLIPPRDLEGCSVAAAHPFLVLANDFDY